MPETILVAVAWPYANAEIHAGNLAGSYLPADIFARYHRLKGNKVLMISGSDSHGSAITIRADEDKKPPEVIYKHFHAGFLELFQQLGLTYDLFTSTHTSNHFKISQTMFTALLEKGFLYKNTAAQWYSPKQKRFLPDRYVEGTCYICSYENARSDQCDNCGNLLDSAQLKDPRSKVDGSVPELRETEHFYLDLGGLQDKVEAFLKERESYWRPNVLRQSLGQITSVGLKGRPITRDLEWGIPVPVEGWDDKRIYVWFEAVIGYLSGTIEWSVLFDQKDSWRKWWKDQKAKAFYFIGKDNIPFHATIWPAELMGSGKKFDELLGEEKPQDFVLPYDVPANEFLNLEGKKISGSRNWGVWGRDFLTRYDPDPLRYYLTSIMPETRDSDWDWEEFYHRNNDVLVATWGNLVNRVLSFGYKNWEGVVPEPGELDEIDKALLDSIEKGFETVGRDIEKVKLRSALNEATRLASEVNKYLDSTAPWFAIKEDKTTAGKYIYVAMRAIDSLKIMFAPFLPFTCQQLHYFMGYEDDLFGVLETQEINDELGEHTILHYDGSKAKGEWKPSEIKGGRKLNQPKALFKKLDISIVEEERARLG